MVQINPCLIGTAFLGAMLSMTTGKSKDVVLELKGKLNEQELWVYEQARQERQGLFMTGLILGMIVGFAMLYYLAGSYNPLTNGCLFSSVVMTFSFFYYMLMPKKYVVIEHLDDGYKRQVWQKVRVTMQKLYWGGFAAGLVGYLILGYGLTSQE